MTGTDADHVYPIRLPDRPSLRLRLRRMAPGRCTVTITDDQVIVRAGTWTTAIRLSDIEDARTVDVPGQPPPGVHLRHGRCTVAGSPGPVVRLTLSPNAGFVPAIHELDVAVTDPGALVRQLTEGPAPL